MEYEVKKKAPAKINLHLHVGHRREDGFHEIESLFLAVDVGDNIRLAFGAEKGGCEIIMPGPVAPEDNIVHRAVTLFRSVTGWDAGVRIEIEKRLPFGAGLGGGSSDAAAVLKGLEHLSGMVLPRYVRWNIAAQLGSDVPFFLEPGAAYVGGRGEVVEPLAFPYNLPIVLVNPGIHSDTATAYSMLDMAREQGKLSCSQPLGKQILKRALEGRNIEEWPFYNDFLKLFLEETEGSFQEIYRKLIGDLKRTEALFVSMSGSGATCFGIFEDPVHAQDAARWLSSRWDFVELTFPLARS
ncbi:MAG: 4-(cytidine 5'-diphospho)-2-C-methyl-D-erythritol kinase [Treponemataceae bacterium]|nr:4-(cytidine 5'-diphospho)-2-C-methyl-D-erythritol kinase [Treponemataceae bacterium]